jgi:hypothetical protein
MAGEGIRELALYHEQRACTAPTAARLFDHFADISRHHLTRDAHHIKTFDPKLTALQLQLLELLGIPASADTSARRSGEDRLPTVREFAVRADSGCCSVVLNR